MTATEELRRMLDERGIKWDELQSYEGGKMTRWRDSTGRYVTAYDDGIVTFFADFYWQPTARQAIDATLGRGTCRPVDGYDDDGEEIGEVCSECGEPWPYFNARYCPNCGAKVVDDAQDDG